jgi:hypothetical protein
MRICEDCPTSKVIGTSLPTLFVGHLKQGRNFLSWRPGFAIHASISPTV